MMAAVLRVPCLTMLAAHVLLRILVKCSLAARGAEVVGHTAILGFTGGRLFVYFHTTYWVDSHFNHSFELNVQRAVCACRRLLTNSTASVCMI